MTKPADTTTDDLAQYLADIRPPAPIRPATPRPDQLQRDRWAARLADTARDLWATIRQEIK